MYSLPSGNEQELVERFAAAMNPLLEVNERLVKQLRQQAAMIQDQREVIQKYQLRDEEIIEWVKSHLEDGWAIMVILEQVMGELERPVI